MLCDVLKGDDSEYNANITSRKSDAYVDVARIIFALFVNGLTLLIPSYKEK
jgi:hypothetical protein